MNQSVQKDDLRIPVWVGLSELFLDTELGPMDWWSIAEVLAASPYNDEKLEQIYTDEVAPVLVHNLWAPIGVWSGFDKEWLASKLRAKEKPLYTFPILGAMIKNLITDGTREDFGKVMKRVHLLRSPVKPSATLAEKVAADGPVLHFVACRMSGFEDIRVLFNNENESGSFLEAAKPPTGLTELIQVAGLTVGGIKVRVTESVVEIEQVQILPPYFLDKVRDVLQLLVTRYEPEKLPIRLTLLNIAQFRGVPEQLGFNLVEDGKTASKKFVSYLFDSEATLTR